MPRGHKSKLRAREKRRQNRAEAQSLKSAEAATGEDAEAACSSSSVLAGAPSNATGAGPLQTPSSAPATTSATAGVSCKRSAGKAKGRVCKSKSSSQASPSPESFALDILTQKASHLVDYLLNQYQMKEPIRKTDMLKIVHKWYRKDFSEILKMASDHMDLVYGLELKEVKPNGNLYTLVQNEDATSDESVSRAWTFPIKGILMPVLSVIFLNGNRTSEKEIWEFLNMMGIYDGKSHFIFGDTRKLITQDLVQEEYLVYQQVPNSDPPCYEFLWGPRAHAETSKMKILEFVAKMNDRVPTSFPAYYAEALKDEEERARAALKASSPSKAGSDPRPASSHYPQPE
ncbi:melanoma-associated antigen B2-like [Phyllostomus discolor]|uniref:Melanoma-associated antigen B2-like n=1 Tax=Phyllostomus discolor TaxID=89673 RepID=A0A6J2MID9_9CHIR|nr:melanoma-associated antigen B2-like [Phyllostomus discolor]